MSEQRKKIMLIANYWHFETEKASSRYRSFANILCGKYDLEVITSSFCHLTKKQRKLSELEIEKLPYKVTLQFERGYKKNICPQRIMSYMQFGRNVSRYLRQQKKPDLIIVSVPSLAVADYVTRYAEHNNIPIIVDIQDLWPEAFKMAVDIPLVSDMLFYPMKMQAQRIYSKANTIMAVSDTYARYGKQYNESADMLSIYIGTDSNLVDEKTKDVIIEKNPEEFWVGYVGALGHSYDIKMVIAALHTLQKKGYDNIVFKVMGEGVCRDEFESYASSLGVQCEFTGMLEYGRMMQVLRCCDVAVNPIVDKSVSTIINKVSDYAAAGVPVVNTQKSEEYCHILEKYHAGINVEISCADKVAEAIELLYNDTELREDMKQKEKVLFMERFDRCRTYPKLLDEIEKYLYVEG